MSTLRINKTAGRHYRVRVRLRGGRKWYLLSGTYRSKRAAYIALVENLVATEHARGDVLLCGDWYEPTAILEARKP